MYISLLLNFIVPFVMVLTGGIIKRHPNHNMGKQNSMEIFFLEQSVKTEYTGL